MNNSSIQHQRVEQLNRNVKHEHACLFYEGSCAFGSEEIQRYRLGNGLALLLLTDRSAPTVSYSTWFRVGSRHEQPGKTGLAHFFEHLMFNETTSLKPGELDRKLEENGAESNAATWVDYTYYYESLPANRLSLAIRLESDRMQNLVLKEAQISSEKEVVSNERRFRVEDDIEGSISEFLYKHAFTKHAYGWPTIGWMEDIATYSPADCESFYRTYYAPNNATIVIVGDIRESNVLKKIQEAYGPIPPSYIPAENIFPEPPQLTAQLFSLKKPTATEKILMGYRGPALGDADHAALVMFNELLFGGRASRIHRLLVTQQALASEVRGWVSPFVHPGLYEIGVHVHPGHTIAEVQPILDAELDRIRNELVSEDELIRAKTHLELAILQSLETASGKAEQIGFYETTLSEPAGIFRRLEMYKRLTAAELRNAARRYLNESQRTVIHVYPEGTPKELS
ncbi:M16 family metallopeptidase [Pajaroellobacter abortibovis]|uniref:Peptidase M16 n=1 Tax=Pajaroellobacter abortibovis TaxID=1882918 RepID=A0A1L6MWR5_9BACT|nr:pitrilysin family protein [Pajaroellobacter abortibovis]APR99982.1 hypothetical protein BCY86_04260 [Pajaroellobacter abortibovis]